MTLQCGNGKTFDEVAYDLDQRLLYRLRCVQNALSRGPDCRKSEDGSDTEQNGTILDTIMKQRQQRHLALCEEKDRDLHHSFVSLRTFPYEMTDLGQHGIDMGGVDLGLTTEDQECVKSERHVAFQESEDAARKALLWNQAMAPTRHQVLRAMTSAIQAARFRREGFESHRQRQMERRRAIVKLAKLRDERTLDAMTASLEWGFKSIMDTYKNSLDAAGDYGDVSTDDVYVDEL